MTCKHLQLEGIEPDFELHRYGVMPWRRCPDCGLRCEGPLLVTTAGQFAMVKDELEALAEQLTRDM